MLVFFLLSLDADSGFWTQHSIHTQAISRSCLLSWKLFAFSTETTLRRFCLDFWACQVPGSKHTYRNASAVGNRSQEMSYGSRCPDSQLTSGWLWRFWQENDVCSGKSLTQLKCSLKEQLLSMKVPQSLLGPLVTIQIFIRVFKCLLKKHWSEHFLFHKLPNNR